MASGYICQKCKNDAKIEACSRRRQEFPRAFVACNLIRLRTDKNEIVYYVCGLYIIDDDACIDALTNWEPNLKNCLVKSG